MTTGNYSFALEEQQSVRKFFNQPLPQGLHSHTHQRFFEYHKSPINTVLCVNANCCMRTIWVNTSMSDKLFLQVYAFQDAENNLHISAIAGRANCLLDNEETKLLVQKGGRLELRPTLMPTKSGILIIKNKGTPYFEFVEMKDKMKKQGEDKKEGVKPKKKAARAKVPHVRGNQLIARVSKCYHTKQLPNRIQQPSVVREIQHRIQQPITPLRVPAQPPEKHKEQDEKEIPNEHEIEQQCSVEEIGKCDTETIGNTEIMESPCGSVHNTIISEDESPLLVEAAEESPIPKTPLPIISQSPSAPTQQSPPASTQQTTTDTTPNNQQCTNLTHYRIATLNAGHLTAQKVEDIDSLLLANNIQVVIVTEAGSKVLRKKFSSTNYHWSIEGESHGVGMVYAKAYSNLSKNIFIYNNACIAMSTLGPIMGVYLPPSMEEDQLKQLSELITLTQPVIIIGDTNHKLTFTADKYTLLPSAPTFIRTTANTTQRTRPDTCHVDQRVHAILEGVTTVIENPADPYHKTLIVDISVGFSLLPQTYHSFYKGTNDQGKEQGRPTLCTFCQETARHPRFKKQLCKSCERRRHISDSSVFAQKLVSPKAWSASKKLDRSNYIPVRTENVIELACRWEADSRGPRSEITAKKIPENTNFITREEVDKAVQQIKCKKNKAVGPDLISYKDIHSAAIDTQGKEEGTIVDTMWRQFNNWLEDEIPIPEGRVVMIEKPDGSGRPILVQNALWNVFQLILKSKLLAATNHNYDTLYGKTQLGYREGVSCVDCLRDLMSHANATPGARILSLDASKAFDRIYRKVIVEELEKLPIDGLLLSALQRSVQVGCRVVNAGGIITCRGVPQGGIMSGMFYNIGIRSLDKAVDCYLVRYADDIHLVITDENDDNEKKISDFNSIRGIDNNPKKTQILPVADPSRGELVCFGKTLKSDGKKVDIFSHKVPPPDVQLRINTKLNPVQKLQVYKATTVASWAYGLEVKAEMDIGTLDSNMRGRIKELLGVGMHVSKEHVLQATGNKFLPSYFLIKRARRAARNPSECPEWAKGTTPLEAIEPHPLLNNPYGKLLLTLREERVDKDASCPLCGDEKGSLVDHIFQCSTTPDITKLHLERGKLLQQATNEALYLLGSAMNKRKEIMRAKNPKDNMSQTQKVFSELWFSAIKAGKTSSKEIMLYIEENTDYNKDVLKNLKRWFIEKQPKAWQAMEEALQRVIDTQKKDPSYQKKQIEWVRQVSKAKDKHLLGLVIRKLLSKHRTSGYISQQEVMTILKINLDKVKVVHEIIKNASNTFKTVRQHFPLTIRPTMNPQKTGVGTFPVAPSTLLNEINKAILQKGDYRLGIKSPIVKDLLQSETSDTNDGDSEEVEEDEGENDNEGESDNEQLSQDEPASQTSSNESNDSSDVESVAPESSDVTNGNQLPISVPQLPPQLPTGSTTPAPKQSARNSSRNFQAPMTPPSSYSSLSFMTRTTARHSAVQQEARRSRAVIQRQNSNNSKGWKP